MGLVKWWLTSEVNGDLDKCSVGVGKQTYGFMRKWEKREDKQAQAALHGVLLQKSTEIPDSGWRESGPKGLSRMGEMRACSQDGDTDNEIVWGAWTILPLLVTGLPPRLISILVCMFPPQETLPQPPVLTWCPLSPTFLYPRPLCVSFTAPIPLYFSLSHAVEYKPSPVRVGTTPVPLTALFSVPSAEPHMEQVPAVWVVFPFTKFVELMKKWIKRCPDGQLFILAFYFILDRN